MQRTSLSQLTFISDSSHLHARISWEEGNLGARTARQSGHVHSVIDGADMCAIGFLVAADAAALAKAAGVKALAAGAQVQCKVSKVDKKRKLVTVVAASNTEPLKEADGLTLAALMPGTLVAARVQAVLPDGLLLNFLSCFTVCSALPH
jgi:hypothetical protein